MKTKLILTILTLAIFASLASAQADSCNMSIADEWTVVDTSSSRSFVTYYGYGYSPRTTHPSDWALISSFPSFATASNCSLISLIDVHASITHSTIDSAESTIVCMELPTSGGLLYEGRRCDTIGTLHGFETAPIDLQFRIPDGYWLAETQIDTILIHVSSSSPSHRDFTIDRQFITPFFNATPPDVDFLFDDSLYFYAGEELACFEATDGDTAVHTETIRVDLIDDDEIYSLNPYSGLFMTIDGITYLQLEDTMVTLTGDTLVLDGFVDICITQLEDYFGCGIDTMCRTVELPGLESFELEIQAGWNLLSLPISSSNWDSLLFPESSEPIYTFDPVAGLYVETETVELGKGFWFFSFTATTLEIENYFSTRASWELYPGWNIIGMPYIETEIDSIETDGLLLPAYLYNPETRIYEESSTLRYGNGYFIFAEDTVDIEIE
ncbi:MAG: hypothetical protein ACLFSQ_11300 [Candidatus Zixiibacteriota bacterium]